MANYLRLSKGVSPDVGLHTALNRQTAYSIIRDAGEYASVNVFGVNSDIDTTEDIWDGGGTWTEPTAARVHSVVSTSANDDFGGTGTNVLTVEGLDSSGLYQSEVVTMDGATPVNTSNSYKTILNAYSSLAGSLNTNDGDITLTAATDLTVTAKVLAGNGKTLMAIFTVPSNRRAVLYGYYGSVNGNTGSADVYLLERPGGSATQYFIRHIMSIQAGGAPSFQYKFDAPYTIEANSRVKIQVVPKVTNMNMSAGFDLFMVNV